MKRYDTILAVNAQRTYCDTNRVPMFAPDNGWCVYCGHNIFEPYSVRRGTETMTYGISVEDAGKRLITGCPFCHTTFCD